MVILIGCFFISCGSEPRNYTQEREEIRNELTNKAQQITNSKLSNYPIKNANVYDDIYATVYNSIYATVYDSIIEDFHGSPKTIKSVLTGEFGSMDSMPNVDAIKKHYKKLGGNIEVTEYQHSIIVKGWDKNRKTVDDAWIYNEERGKFYVYYGF